MFVKRSKTKNKVYVIIIFYIFLHLYSSLMLDLRVNSYIHRNYFLT